ncbi:hypothetical protein LPJ61_004614 [Coemansia biformis]|uniref:lytic cellulose monooxygenase (C4-dehydrogenating) n=1 Tax=Coemansia biformis TaxID=1286918 RepID=A0A9W7Y4I4_9FUNG|nr:hypothetical protein LPJ61_004614 [Coemansia biformis]
MHITVCRLAAATALVTLLASVADAHTILASIKTDGKQYGVGECIRTWWKNPAGPVQDVQSLDLRCRTTDMDGSKTKTCPVSAGSEMTVTYVRVLKGDKGVISQSHTGPVMVYIAPLASNGEGDVWVKIYEDGWTKESNEWGTDRLIASKGLLTFKIPANIKPGNYILRTEVIALHNASSKGGAQLFPNCIHVQITGTGTIALPAGVAIPGYYKDTDPGILYKRKKFGDNSNYIIPGPPLYKGSGGAPPAGGPTAGEPTSAGPQNAVVPVPTSKPACIKKRSKKRSRKRIDF